MHVKFDDKEPGSKTPEQDESIAVSEESNDYSEPDRIPELDDTSEAAIASDVLVVEASKEDHIDSQQVIQSMNSFKYKASHVEDQIIGNKESPRRTRSHFRQEESALGLLSVIEPTTVDEEEKVVATSRVSRGFPDVSNSVDLIEVESRTSSPNQSSDSSDLDDATLSLIYKISTSSKTPQKATKSVPKKTDLVNQQPPKPTQQIHSDPSSSSSQTQTQTQTPMTIPESVIETVVEESVLVTDFEHAVSIQESEPTQNLPLTTSDQPSSSNIQILDQLNT